MDVLIGQQKQTSLPRLEELDIAKQFEGMVIVSPEAAQQALVLNLGNRHLRKTSVAWLVSQIENGEWQSDHPSPIVFSPTRLIDGQHRLTAIAKSGRTINCKVITGARDELRKHIDTGVPRSMRDRETFYSDHYLNDSVSTMITMWWYLSSKGSRKATSEECWEIFAKHKDGIDAIASLLVNRRRGMSRGAVMIALAEYAALDKKKAVDFGLSLMSPDGKVQQARMLRDYILRTPASGYTAVKTTYDKSVYCMRCHLEDKQVSRVLSGAW
jgi:hypothetical protein